MIVEHVRLRNDGKTVLAILTAKDGSTIETELGRKRSWSARKLVDLALKQSGATPGAFLRYGWDK